MIIEFILGLLIALLIGTCSFWLVGKFSPEPPSFKISAIGALVIEIPTVILSALNFPLTNFIVLIIAWIALVKIAFLDPRSAFFGAFLYGVIRFVIVFVLLASILKL